MTGPPAAGSSDTSWETEAAWAAVAAIGALLAVSPTFLGLPIAHDVTASDWWQMFAGYADAVGDHARAGALPRLLAGPHLGTDFAGQIEAGPLYPPSWLLCGLFGPFLGLQALYAFHVVVGASGAYTLARLTRLHAGAAAFVGVAFGASGFVVAHVKHPSIVGSSVWLPWALAGVLLLSRGPWPGVPLLALASALPWFPAHPQIAFYGALCTGAFALAWHRHDRRALLTALGSLALGGVVALASVVPAQALASHSFRSAATWEFASAHALDPADLAYFVVPALRGVPYAGTWQPVWQPDALAWEDYAYVGLFSVLLAGYAAARFPAARAVAVIAGVLVLLAAGPWTPLYRLAWTVLPGVALFRFPQRLLWLVGLSVAWLAGRALCDLARERRVAVGAIVVLVLDLLVAHHAWLPTIDYGAARPSDLVTVARADLGDGADDAAPPRVPRVYVVDAVTMWFEAFAAFEGPQAYEPLVALPIGNLAAVYGVESPDGHVALQSTISATAWAPANRDQVPDAPPLPVVDDGVLVGLERLEDAAVTHVITRAPVRDQGLVQLASDGSRFLYRLPHPRPSAYVETGGALVNVRQIDVSPVGDTEVWAAAGPGTLVVARAYDVGWTATIDGSPAPVRVVHAWQRGVDLPAGEHTITFRYEPPGFRLGLAFGALGLLCTLVASALAWRHRAPVAVPDPPHSAA